MIRGWRICCGRICIWACSVRRKDGFRLMNRIPLCLQGGYHREGVRLLLRCTVGGCINNMHKLKWGLTEWIYGRKIFPVRTVKLRNWLLREAVQSPSMEVFKTQLYKKSWATLTLLWAGDWARDLPSSMNHSTVLHDSFISLIPLLIFQTVCVSGFASLFK